MNIEQATEMVSSAVNDALNGKIDITAETQLVGDGSVLDSLHLVEICLSLEDLADENGFEFDWKSGIAVSDQTSMFQNVSALAQEFARQSQSS